MSKTNFLQMTLPDYGSQANWARTMNANLILIDRACANLSSQINVVADDVSAVQKRDALVEIAATMEFKSSAPSNSINFHLDEYTTIGRVFLCVTFSKIANQTSTDDLVEHYIITPVELSYNAEFKLTASSVGTLTVSIDSDVMSVDDIIYAYLQIFIPTGINT